MDIKYLADMALGVNVIVCVLALVYMWWGFLWNVARRQRIEKVQDRVQVQYLLATLDDEDAVEREWE